MVSDATRRRATLLAMTDTDTARRPIRRRREKRYPYVRSVALSAGTGGAIEAIADRDEISAGQVMRECIEAGLASVTRRRRAAADSEAQAAARYV